MGKRVTIKDETGVTKPCHRFKRCGRVVDNVHPACVALCGSCKEKLDKLEKTQ